MSKSEYRGQDTVLEKIKQTFAQATVPTTWNAACELVADGFTKEELYLSAEVARGHRD